MVAAWVTLGTIILLGWASWRDYLLFRQDPAVQRQAKDQLARHTRFALIALTAGAAIIGGLVISTGPNLLHLMTLLFLCTAVWPAVGSAGYVLAAKSGLPRSRQPVPWGKIVLLAVGLTIIGQFMRLLINWQPTSAMSQVTDEVGAGGSLAGLCFLGLMLLMAVYEEIVFRHYLLPKLRSLLIGRVSGTFATILAVVASSLLFAAWHFDMVYPAWMKPTQTFIYGLGFAWARIFYGTRAAIAAHVGLNALVILSTVVMGLI